MTHEDPLAPHSHDPNPDPPSTEPAIMLEIRGRALRLSPDDLRRHERASVADCYIVSTGHGTSGPFTFGGVAVLTLLQRMEAGEWSVVEFVSGDGFGTRVSRAELESEPTGRQSLLAYEINGRALSRREGLVRLIVPSERDDALKQVKWIAAIRVK